MSNTKKKKENIFVAYFRPFGIRQICDILMLVSAILMVIGVFVNETMLLVALIIFLLADAVMLTKHLLVVLSKINRKSPEYRNALSNMIITGIMFLIAVFGLIYFFVR